MGQPLQDLPPEVIEQERDIQPQGEPFLGTQEHDAEEAVDGVLWQHQLKRKQRHRPGSERGKADPTPPASDSAWTLPPTL